MRNYSCLDCTCLRNCLNTNFSIDILFLKLRHPQYTQQMYSWTIRQDAMNRSLIFIENSYIYHMVRSLFFRIASPRNCTVFRRFSSVGLFFLKYFLCILWKKNHGNWILRSEKHFCVILSVSWPYEFLLESVQVLWISARSMLKRHFAKNPHLLTIALSILLKKEIDFIEPQLLWNHTKLEIFFIWRIGIVYCTS